ncbi:MAG: hypothetical protein M3361_21205, partial [Candidatus Tectomicrobia bacterium]|nr:hypothetical protein [Candidatus Tectomicrobia bacterium]
MTTPVSQKLTKLLELIATRSAYHGAEVELDPAFDYPLMDARSDEEVHYLFNEANKRHYLDSTGEFGNPICSLTVDGWDYLDQLSKKDETKEREVRSVTPTREFAFVKDVDLRMVLERDYAEIHRAYDVKCWKSVVILCG